MNTGKIRLAAIAALGFSLAFWPLILWFAQRLSDGGDEPYGLIVLCVLSLLIMRGQNHRHTRMSKGSQFAAAISFTLYILSLFGLPPMLRCIPAILCLSFYYGWHRQPGWMALLFLSLPVISSLEFYLSYPLRIISSETTRWLVWPFVNEIAREGTNLTAYGKVVGVDAPCSGIRMLWVGLVFSNILISLIRMTWIKAIVFNLFAIVILLFANSIRAALLFAPESGFIEISDTTHESIGLVSYLGAIVILIKVAMLRRGYILYKY